MINKIFIDKNFMIPNMLIRSYITIQIMHYCNDKYNISKQYEYIYKWKNRSTWLLSNKYKLIAVKIILKYFTNIFL